MALALFPLTIRPLTYRMTATIVASLALTSALAYSQQEGSSSSSEALFIRGQIHKAAAACNREDLDAYADCFEKRRRDAVRRFAAPLFVQHALHMEIVDAHVISTKRERADVAVKYSVSLTEHKYEILSIVHLKRSHDAWLISRETIQSFVEPHRAVSSCMGGGCTRLGGGCPIRSSCSGGTCGLAGP